MTIASERSFFPQHEVSVFITCTVLTRISALTTAIYSCFENSATRHADVWSTRLTL